MLLGAMPAITRLHEDDARQELRWALNRMRQELADSRPGGILVAQHLAHLVLVQALRAYLSGQAGRHVGWLFALADPQLAAVIAAMHAEPGAHWTLPTLAAKAGMSRSRFARTFKATVGRSPIEYLTQWRMLLAADRLRKGRQSLAIIARQSGYESESAFSVAFKRAMGSSPRNYARGTLQSGADHPWAMTTTRRMDHPSAQVASAKLLDSPLS